MSNSLKSKTVIATAWSLFGFAGTQLVRLGSNLVMTRLLTPEMFGVMAIVNVIIMGFHLISDIGLRPSIVQRQKDLNDSFLNTAWTVQIIKGFLLWIAVLLSALMLYLLQETEFINPGSVYANDQLPILVAIVGATAIISGFNSVTLFTENRKLKMGKLTVINLGSRFVSVAVMLVWAVLSPTIWALVAGAVSVVIVKMIMSHLYLDYRKHQVHLDKEDAKEIIKFGKWIALSTFATFMITQGDRLILGGFISASDLGIYTIAYVVVSSVRRGFRGIASMVLLPALSEVVRSRPKELSRIYYKIRLLIDIPVLFCCGLLAWSGQDIINFLYDERYAEAGFMLQILTFSLIEVGFSFSGPCLTAVGKPGQNALGNSARAIALWVITPIAFVSFGIHAALWAIALNFLVSIPIQFWFLSKANVFRWYKEVWTLPMVLVGYAVGYI